MPRASKPRVPKVAKLRPVKMDDFVALTSSNYGDTIDNPKWGGRNRQVVGHAYAVSGDTAYVEWDNGSKNTYRLSHLTPLECLDPEKYASVNAETKKKMKDLKKLEKFVSIDYKMHRDRNGIGGRHLQSIVGEAYAQLTPEEKKKIPKLVWCATHDTGIGPNDISSMNKKYPKNTVFLWNYSYYSRISARDRITITDDYVIGKERFKHGNVSGSSWCCLFTYVMEPVMEAQLKRGTSILLNEDGNLMSLNFGKHIFIPFDIMHYPVPQKKDFIKMVLIILRAYLHPHKISISKLKEMAINKVVSQMVNNQNRDYEKAIKDVTSYNHKIGEMQQLVTRRAKDVVELKKSISSKSAVKKLFFESIAKLRKKRMIINAKIQGSSLVVMTNNIQIYGKERVNDDGREAGKEVIVNAGKYIIKLGFLNGTVNIKNLGMVDKNPPYHHPHVAKDGTPCLGNLSSLIKDAVRRGDVGGAAFTLCGYLSTWNPRDAHTSFNNFRDVLKKYSHTKRETAPKKAKKKENKK